jgi:Membrane-associating domain
MAIERIVIFALRVAQLVFAAIVAGINGDFLHDSQGVDSWTIGRQIYTEVAAALYLFFALIWLVPFSSDMTSWPLDVVISLCWWAAFGLLVDVSPSSLHHTHYDSPRLLPFFEFHAELD